MTATVEDALDQRRRQDAAGIDAAGTDGAGPEHGTVLTIAEMAQRCGVSAHTLRYYERIGLLTVGRDASGHRAYTAADFARVVFLTRLRMTGMPIRTLQRYVELVGDGEQTVPERLDIMVAHRAAVRAQLDQLTAALETIEFKIATYGGRCGS